jgi:hypothetical protein
MDNFTKLLLVNLVLIVLLIILIIQRVFCQRVDATVIRLTSGRDGNGNLIEGLDTGVTPSISGTDSEALQNIASLYNGNTLVIDNLKVTGNAELNGDTMFGGSMKVFGGEGAQDKIQIYKDGNGSAPYLFYNKGGDLGLWDGTAVTTAVTHNGKFVSGAANIDANDVNSRLNSGEAQIQNLINSKVSYGDNLALIGTGINENTNGEAGLGSDTNAVARYWNNNHRVFKLIQQA